MRILFLLTTAICCCYLHCFAQSSSDATTASESKGITNIPEKSLSFIESKYNRLTTSLQQQSTKMLQRMQRKEQRLRSNLQRKDSMLAKVLFQSSESKYKALQQSLASKADTSLLHPLQEYIPNIDSMQTTLSFLKQGDALQSLTSDKLKQVNELADRLKELQARMQQANDIQAYIRQRQQELKDKLLNSGIAKQFKSINKEAFYYEQRLREYKELINDKQKLEQKAIALVKNLPAFQKFWQKNSYLAQLFLPPANYGTPQALAGLQTRGGVQQQLQQRFGMSNFNAATPANGGASAGNNNYLQQQMEAAQTQLGQLKDKLNNLGITGGSGDMTMPDFKPNSQHTKSFLKRIEYGLNMQSQKSSWGIPVTSDIALTAGYKLNDKSTVGIGAAYRMGWGHSGFKHIVISHEGVGLRSYVDIKAKGHIWISGGYELNYMQSFKKLPDLYNINVWQRSGLIGLTKKYKVGKKENNMQLFWDFLSYNQIPHSPALKFRVGFKL